MKRMPRHFAKQLSRYRHLARNRFRKSSAECEHVAHGGTPLQKPEDKDVQGNAEDENRR